MTLGEQRVRVRFNPSQTDLVSQIKQKTAEIIDLVNSLKGDGSKLIDGEHAREIVQALTEYESAGHWAVKAATYGL